MTLNAEQQQVYDDIMNGQSVFLTGNAGTGKSYLLNQVINDLRKQKRHFYVAAPTGIAAINVKGTTIHRLIGLSSSTDTLSTPNRRYMNRAEELFNPQNDLLIIDEISMCRVDIFSFLIQMIKHSEALLHFKMQLVVVGDFSQLSPFCGYKEKYLEKELYARYHGLYAFLSPEWKSCNFKTYCLNKIVRQHDPNFVQALNAIRLGNPVGLQYINQKSSPFPLENAITLCGRKKTVDTKNQNELNKIAGPEFTFRSYSSPKFAKNAKPTVEELNLKINARVMITANGQAEQKDGISVDFYNGEMATVKAISYKKAHKNVKIDPAYLAEDHNDKNDQVENLFKKEVFDFNAPRVNDDGGQFSDPRHVTITLENEDGKSFDISWHVWQEFEYKKDHKGVMGKVSAGAYCQLPLALAYAITIHKSQGQTFDRANFAPEVWADGQLYVALSRVRSVAKFYTENKLSSNLVKASNVVTDFYADNNLFEVGSKPTANTPKINRQPLMNFLTNLTDDQFTATSKAMQFIFDSKLDIEDKEQRQRFIELCQEARQN